MHRSAALAFSLVLSMGVAAQAPCPPLADDGFAARPCCTPVTPNIPDFPTLECPGVFFDFVSSQTAPTCPTLNLCNPTYVLHAPVIVDCDTYSQQIDVFVGGTLFATGIGVLQYSRTFGWFDTTRQQLSQVWRFLLNIDFTFPNGALGCSLPTCWVPGRPVHFVGSVDYNCYEEEFPLPKPGGEPPAEETKWVVRMDLTHHDPDIHHQVCRVGQWHSDIAYAAMCPTPVSYTNVPYPSGNFTEEAIRETDWVAGVCRTEIFSNMQGAIVNWITPPCPRRTDQQIGAVANCTSQALLLSNMGNPTLPQGTTTIYLADYGASSAGAFPAGLAVYTSVDLTRYTTWQCNPNNPGPNLIGHAVTTAARSGTPFRLFPKPPLPPGPPTGAYDTMVDRGDQETLAANGTVQPFWACPAQYGLLVQLTR